MSLYPLLRPLLFQLQAETAHNSSFRAAELAQSLGLLGAVLPAAPQTSDHLARTVFGLRFPHPIGLAAGMDKDARVLPLWRRLGFAFVEVGTVTPRPQPGNPKPRLFRLPKDRALINRMGFNNAGMEILARRLERRPQGLLLGVNIGKNKDTPNERALDDYQACLERLHSYADYLVVNVSSPNTPELRALQAQESLEPLLAELQNRNQQLGPKPLLLKIAPDLNPQQIQAIVETAHRTQLAGLIATNTTVERGGLQTPGDAVEALGPGGLSGAPLKERALEVLKLLRQSELPLVGVGGLETGQDVQERLAAGASLVQVYSALVYHGPGLVRNLLAELHPHQ